MRTRRYPPIRRDRPLHQRFAPVATALLVVVTLAGCAAADNSGEPSGIEYSAQQAPADTPAPTTERPSAPQPTVDADRLAEIAAYRSVREPVAVAEPTHIAIPAIDVHSDLERLGRDRDGGIAEPIEWDAAGWYAPGVRPGQRGPAVILGHVDSHDGPAVFYRLRDLEPGEEVTVTRRDGSTVTFAVDRIERHAKTRFPTDDVYLTTGAPTLRLVTCGGTFDRASGHYRDNLVVFADMVTD